MHAPLPRTTIIGLGGTTFRRQWRWPTKSISQQWSGINSSTWCSTRRNTQEVMRSATIILVSKKLWLIHGHWSSFYILVDYFTKHPCKYLTVAPKEVCQDTAHLERFFQDIIDNGGEGIILRDPLAPLQPGNTTSYLKHKADIPLIIFFFADALFFFSRFDIRNIATMKQRLSVGPVRINGNVNCEWHR